MRSVSSCGSKWMSVAPSVTACSNTRLTNRITAASSSSSSSAATSATVVSPSRLSEPTPRCSVRNFAILSGGARTQRGSRSQAAKTQSSMRPSGGQAVARQSTSGSAVTTGTQQYSWTRRTGICWSCGRLNCSGPTTSSALSSAIWARACSGAIRRAWANSARRSARGASSTRLRASSGSSASAGNAMAGGRVMAAVGAGARIGRRASVAGLAGRQSIHRAHRRAGAPVAGRGAAAALR